MPSNLTKRQVEGDPPQALWQDTEPIEIQIVIIVTVIIDFSLQKFHY